MSGIRSCKIIDMTTPSANTNRRLRDVVKSYFSACSGADQDRLSIILEDDVVHYRPSGAIVGHSAFVAHVSDDVASTDASWQADTITCDAQHLRAIAEWTGIKPKIKRVLRGCSCFEFSSRGRIREVRVYFCAPPERDSLLNQLPGFPYRTRMWTSLPVAESDRD